MQKHPTFIFFGTGYFAEPILKNLIDFGYIPTYIITSPDKPAGRHQIMTPPRVVHIAQEYNIPFFQPEKLRTPEALAELKTLIDQVDVCVVADYGKILPQALLDLCPKGFLNIHPSLLPLHRGPIPMQATILGGNNATGVTIIRMDAEMDHGPIVAVQHEEFPLESWPCLAFDFYQHMAKVSARLLIETLPRYIAGEITPTEQDHDAATYTKMIDKKDAEVLFDDIHSNNLTNIYKKYCAYKDWPEIFFIHNGKRVKIKKMSLIDGNYTIDRVTPEGKKEMGWEEYKRGHNM